MSRAKNIVKILILTAVVLLSGMARYACAQPNTGAGPYLNSWHTYRVVVGGIANTREWDITDGTDTIHLANSMAWCDIPVLSGSNADISICFTDSVFSLGAPWYLLYREFTAPGACIAARRFTINLTENNFYLTLSADTFYCKPEEGQVFNWVDLENINFQSTFSFIVTMHKEATLTINHWAFDDTISFDNASHSIIGYSASVVTLNGGTINSITDIGGAYGGANDGIFRVEVSEPDLATLTEVSVSISLTLSGYVYNGVTATLILRNGIINSGAGGLTVSPDNLLRPTAVEQPIIALRDREQSITYSPLPATPNISIVP